MLTVILLPEGVAAVFLVRRRVRCEPAPISEQPQEIVTQAEQSIAVRAGFQNLMPLNKWLGITTC